MADAPQAAQDEQDLAAALALAERLDVLSRENVESPVSGHLPLAAEFLRALVRWVRDLRIEVEIAKEGSVSHE
jgi:hypothetical protein